MIIKQAELKGVYVNNTQLPQDSLPEIALVGRSNVGKSSLINRLVNRKNLAKSSSTPGKTRTINYYLINRQWYLVDLPGYGYAKVSRTEKARWGRMIENFLKERTQVKGVIQLVDIRHEPSNDDILMQQWLLAYGIPVLVAATKADKISRGKRSKHLGIISQALSMNGQLPISFSAETGEGKEEVMAAIDALLNV
ncbi:MAG: ribosome biogenesis GTP-binding protein YihA/YsxC [Syntrophomonadaceae bacterium]|jgi:GTP-binding protein